MNKQIKRLSYGFEFELVFLCYHISAAHIYVVCLSHSHYFSANFFFEAIKKRKKKLWFLRLLFSVSMDMRLLRTCIL